MAYGRIAICFLLAVMADLTCGQTKICGLDNYDVGSLVKQPYWFAKVPQKQCAMELQDGECYIYFSVCQSLPYEVCEVNNTGFCQKITNGTGKNDVTLDAGLSDRIIERENGTLGFQIFYQNGSEFQNCTEIDTIVFFNCDKHEEWDISNPNVTEHVIAFIHNPIGKCEYILQLNYSGACVTQTPIIDICKKQDTYDLETLSGPKEWIATVPKKFCNGSLSTSVSDNATCDLLFSFCKRLPDGSCYNSVFCLPGNYDNPISYGSYNHHLQMESSVDKLSFTITNYNGTVTSKCPEGYFSTIIFNCNSTAIWSEVKDHNITKYISADPDIKECEYIVRFNYSGACPNLIPGKIPSSNPQSPVGWILIGIAVGVGILYFAAGMVVQAARGRKGLDLIPNYNFWRSFFILVLEGFQFTLDVITCYRLKGSGPSISKVDYEKL